MGGTGRRGGCSVTRFTCDSKIVLQYNSFNTCMHACVCLLDRYNMYTILSCITPLETLYTILKSHHLYPTCNMYYIHRASKVTSVHPTLEPVARCHRYTIAYKYTYCCTRCDYRCACVAVSINAAMHYIVSSLFPNLGMGDGDETCYAHIGDATH